MIRRCRQACPPVGVRPVDKWAGSVDNPVDKPGVRQLFVDEDEPELDDEEDDVLEPEDDDDSFLAELLDPLEPLELLEPLDPLELSEPPELEEPEEPFEEDDGVEELDAERLSVR